MNRRRLGAATAGVFLVAVACAHVEPPPGGPEDTAPPGLLTTRPDAGAVVAGYDGPVVLVFDERISEQRIEDAVSVSPRTSPVVVSHGRDEIRVSLRRGWEPGVIYHVGVSRDLRDLFNNSLAQPIRLVFSTGPAIPETSLTGAVVDRITGQPETDVRVEAIRSDSLVYATSTDSVGGFSLVQFPEGDYRVRAFRDLNRNRALDEFEARDSADATVRAGVAATVALRVVDPDSTGPVPGTATLAGLIVQVEFDDYLDPAQELQPTQASVRDSTGAAVPIESVAIGELLEVTADTTTAAAPAGDPPPSQPGAAPGAVPGPAGELASRTLSVQLAEGATLAPGAEYTVAVEGVRNIVGLAGGGETTFEVPEAPPEPDAVPPPAL